MGKGRDRRRCYRERDDPYERSGYFNRHHIVNREHGGGMTKQNLLIMDTHRHRCWHLLFKDLSFDEAAALLIECAKRKRRER